jgi:hypothetical protein
VRELIEKVSGHAEHLLGCFLGLKEKYAFLRPMLFEQDVWERRGSGARSRGFDTIRYSLFYSCVQDVVKLAFDKDKKERTPSITIILSKLKCDSVRKHFRESFDIRLNFSSDEHLDDVTKASLRITEEKHKASMFARFDGMYTSILDRWQEFQDNCWAIGFRTIRDKVTAHLELKKVGEKYQRINVSELDLKWSDVGEAIELLQPLVLDLYRLVGSSFNDMDDFSASLGRATREYWS